MTLTKDYDTKVFVTRKTAAHLVDASPDTIDELVREGLLKVHAIPGRPRIKRYSKEELFNLFKPTT